MRRETRGKRIHIFSTTDNGKSILSSAIHNYILLPSFYAVKKYFRSLYMNLQEKNVSEVWRFKYLKILLYVNHTNFT